MSDLRDIYQEVILDHNKNPRNMGKLDHSSHQAEGHNPLCGDEVNVTILVEDDVIKDVMFDGHGCAISTASSSLMTEGIKGKSIKEVEALFHKFHMLVTDQQPDVNVDASADVDLGKLEVLQGVKEFPIRVKCATLVWHTLIAALKEQSAPVTTE